MKTKLKVIIPIGIALVIIALAFVFIRFDSSEELDLKAMVHNAYEYMTEMDYERAVAEFEKIINIDPRNAEAYIGIAEAYEAMGDIEKAVEWLEKGYEATGDESIKAMLDRLLDDMQGEVSEIVTSVSEEVTTEVTTEETTTETTVEITTVTEETTTETTMVTEEAILEITSITDQTIEVDVHNEVDLLSDFIDVVAWYDTSYNDQSDSFKWHIIESLAFYKKQNYVDDNTLRQWLRVMYNDETIPTSTLDYYSIERNDSGYEFAFGDLERVDVEYENIIENIDGTISVICNVYGHLQTNTRNECEYGLLKKCEIVLVSNIDPIGTKNNYKFRIKDVNRIVSYKYAGSCGENVMYAIDEDGITYIWGNGRMNDYSFTTVSGIRSSSPFSEGATPTVNFSKIP